MHRPHRTQIATSEVQGRHCNALPEKHGSLISVNLHPRHSYGTQSRVEFCHERFLPNHHIACELRAPSCASRRKSSYGSIVILANNTYSRYCKTNLDRRSGRPMERRVETLEHVTSAFFCICDFRFSKSSSYFARPINARKSSAKRSAGTP